MNNQEFIIHTLKGYFTNPETIAYDSGRSECMYRGPNGTKCALGQHIRDDAYSIHMEDTSASQVLEDHPNCLTDEAKAQNLSSGVWLRIQMVHDLLEKDPERVPDAITNLEKIAEVDLSELKALVKS
jgi:hypothetical protein